LYRNFAPVEESLQYFRIDGGLLFVYDVIPADVLNAEFWPKIDGFASFFSEKSLLNESQLSSIFGWEYDQFEEIFSLF
jgi:hypothetical protein